MLFGSEPFFTVVTPTYNRAHLIARVYESLCAQTLRDFEWIILDDGSTDNTQSLAEEFRLSAPFPIRYHYQKNSGKHVAINRSVEMAKGELLVILDSDDWLAHDALASMKDVWESIPHEERRGFAGVVGLYSFPHGAVVGTPFPRSPLDTSAVELQVRFRVQGDKFGANRLDVMREFPFPEDLGRFVPESLVWNRIARQYKLRCVNRVWAYTEYQPDGLSARMLENRISSAGAARLYYQELYMHLLDMQGGGTSVRFKTGVNYVRFSLHAGIPLRNVAADAFSLGIGFTSILPGWLLYQRDRLVVARREWSGRGVQKGLGG